MPQGDEPEELLMDLDLALPPATGTRQRLDLTVEVVRGLAAKDLGEIVALPTRTPEQTIKRVSTAHHRLAQLLATGKTNSEVSLLTGYDPAYISRLKVDPTFAGLLATYGAQREALFVDVIERMKILGLTTLEELQDRLEREPEKWNKRELMDLAELCLGQNGKGQPQERQQSVPVQVNVSFGREAGGPVIEGRVEVLAA